MWSINFRLRVPGNIRPFVNVGWVANATGQSVLMVDGHTFLYKPVTWGAQLPEGGRIDYGLPFFHYRVGLRLLGHSKPTVATSTSTPTSKPKMTTYKRRKLIMTTSTQSR